MKPKKYRYAIHLAKPEIQDYADFLTEAANDKINGGNGKKGGETTIIGDHAVVYTFRSGGGPPRWLKQIKKVFPDADDLTVQSPSAIVLFKKDERIFAATFGFAHSLIDPAARENEFGLRVAINLIKDSDVRTIEKSNLGNAIRDLAQAARRSDLDVFNVDDALEVIRQISGEVGSEDSAIEAVSGASSLSITTEATLDELGEVASDALKLFESDAYKDTQFRIIDVLKPVRDVAQHELLFDSAVASLRNDDAKFELALPEILTGQDIGYARFERAGIKDEFPDISIRDYLAGLGEKRKDLTTEDIKKHRLAIYDPTSGEQIRAWPIASALIGTAAIGDQTYVINEGRWYSVANSLVESANKAFEGSIVPLDPRLDEIKLVPRVDEKTGKTHQGYETEAEYNKRVSGLSGFVCMDKALLKHPLGRREIEVCDLFDVGARKLILVKRSSRRSSTLSHFFRQGVTAARLFFTNDDFRRDAYDKLNQAAGGSIYGDLLNTSPTPFEFEFRIVDHPRPDGTYRIPFFSRLTLRDEFSAIRNLGFKTKLGFVPQQTE